MHKDEFKTIANTIRNQISRITHMACGSRNFMFDSTKQYGNLSFRVGSDRGRIKSILIELMPSDTYKVTYREQFDRGVNKWQEKSREVIDDVYCDMLDDVVYRLVNK